jgi:uncharacterized spore protein YtfJ
MYTMIPTNCKKKKGISTFIAVLLLIVLAVAAGILIYAYTMGYLGIITGTQIKNKAIQIQSIVSSGEQLNAYVKNVGQGSVTLDPSGTSKVYINDVPKGYSILEADLVKELLEGRTCTVSIPISQLDPSWSDKTNKMKILSEDGTFTESTFKISFLTTSTYTIKVTSGIGGSINPPGPVTVAAGGSQSFTISPDTGNMIVDVFVDGASQGAITSYTFNNVQANHEISATFAPTGTTLYIITSTAGAGGSIVPSGDVIVAQGANQIFTITPNIGYVIADVLVDSASQGVITTYSFNNVQAGHSISATFAANQGGTTYTISVAAGSGGSISPAGPTVTVVAGGSQSFTITPNSGYHIVDVVVDSVSQGAVGTYTFTNVQANHVISASFAVNTGVTYTITASAGAGGSITPSGIVVVNAGATQVFAITPNTGYYIVNVVVDSVPQGPIGVCTFSNIQASHVISASFATGTGTTYTITASAGAGGTITPSGSIVVSAGNSQSFTITPNAGYHVVDVVVDSVSQGTIGAFTFTNVQANHVISASFALNAGSMYTITASAGAGGSITPSGAVVVYAGVTQVFMIAPNPGYHIVDVLVDSVSQGPVGSYTFTNIQANHVISASFAVNPGVTYTITASATAGGTIAPSGTLVLNAGASQTFTITPLQGYHIVDVLVDSVSQGAIGSYTFVNVQMNHQIAVAFAANTGINYSIVASATAGGTIAPSGTIVVNAGATQVFTIMALSGFHTVDVVVDGVSQGAIGIYTFTNVQANHVISASFATNTGTTYTITASASAGGTITPTGTTVVNAGATQVFTISPNSGYHVVDVLVDSVSQGAIGTYAFSNVQANHVISANFAVNTVTTYTITVTSGAGGSISPPGPSVVLNAGVTQVFTIAPNTGYHIVNVVVDSVSQGPVGTYTFSNIQANHQISASFALNTGSTYTITASAGTGGTITPSGSVVVTAGATQVFTINPNANYHITDVIVDSVSQGAIGSYTFTNVLANHVITAIFAANTGNSLIFIVSSTTVQTGVRSQPIAISRQTTTGGTLEVTLGSTATTTGYFVNSAGRTISIATINSGQSSTTVYYIDTAPGTPTLTASAINYNNAQITFTITGLAIPKIATVFTPMTSIVPGSQVTDHAVLTSTTADAGGTFTYYLCSGIYATSGTPTVIDSSTQNVLNGIVPDSKVFTMSTAGTYYFLTEYSGDARNSPVTRNNRPEAFVVKATTQSVYTLRPRADTSDDELLRSNPGIAGYQHMLTDDGDASYLYASYVAPAAPWTDSTFRLDAAPTTTGTINYIVIHVVSKTTGNGLVQISIQTNGVEYDDVWWQFPLTSNYMEYTTILQRNPNTNSAWTWSQINALQAGCTMFPQFGLSRCTQVYVEVFYTP